MPEQTTKTGGILAALETARKSLVGIRAANRNARSGPSSRIDLTANTLDALMTAVEYLTTDVDTLTTDLNLTATRLDVREAQQREKGGDLPPLPAIGLDHFQAEVGLWGNETFPASTKETKALHVFREAVELVVASRPQAGRETANALLRQLQGDLTETFERSYGQGKVMTEEAADILVILLHLAHSCSFSLLAAARQKFGVNLTRRWGQPDAAGVTEHVREGKR